MSPSTFLKAFPGFISGRAKICVLIFSALFQYFCLFEKSKEKSFVYQFLPVTSYQGRILTIFLEIRIPHVQVQLLIYRKFVNTNYFEISIQPVRF